jgi:glutathione synthase/RimK-type ligase-like ATP-grasp enzyme
MIVFVGYGDDRAIELTIEAAIERGVRYVMVDQRRAAFTDFTLEVDSSGASGAIHVQGTVVPLADVTAVYARPLSPVPATERRLRERSEMLHDALVAWLDIAEGRVVSRPSAMHSNSSKPFQAQEIAAAGFEVPDTLITTNPDEVHEFQRRHGDVVFKSISGIRSIVRVLDATSARNLERVRDLPTQFQALVPGVDVRVHVVGARVFATEVRSAAVDYRYARQDGADAELTPASLPAGVEERCVALARRLRLPFCGIDLRRRPDGVFVCFEVNPMPGYSYYETHTGQRISDALVEYLTAEVS